jgi:NitT/TauT family transport system permease protein
MTRSVPNRPQVIALRLGLACVLLGTWEYFSAAKIIDPFFFSRPSEIALRVAHWVASGFLWSHLLTTLIETLLSLVIGGCLGTLFGFALGTTPLAARVLDPYIRIANALPRVVLAPIFLLWFGLGIWSKIALGVTVVFFIVFFNTFRGIREVDPLLIDNARMLGASRGQLAQHVLLPSALAWIFSSLHVSVGMAIVAVVVGEYLGASRGIGYLIAQAEGVFDSTAMFAGMAVLAFAVLLIGAAVGRVERRLSTFRSENDFDRGEPFRMNTESHKTRMKAASAAGSVINSAGISVSRDQNVDLRLGRNK